MSLAVCLVACGGASSNDPSTGRPENGGTGVTGAAGSGAGGAGLLGAGGAFDCGPGDTYGPCPPAAPTPDPCSSTPPAAWCDASTCGNGQRDVCQLSPMAPACAASLTVTEECDVTDLGTATCSSLGWGSGSLGCDALCHLDATGCSECAFSPNVLSCANAAVTGYVRDFALAGTDTAVGLAWGEGEPATPLSFHLAQLSPELGIVKVSDLQLDDTGDQTAVIEGALAIAPLPSGWVAARSIKAGIAFQAVDAAGAVLGKVTVDGGDQMASEAVLVPRTGGGPLLVWMGSSKVRAAVISDDGGAASTPIDIAEWGSSFTGTFANGAFYVVAPNDTLGSRLVRVETDGTLGATVALPKSQYSPVLVGGAADLRVLSSSADAKSLFWERFDFNGAALAPPARVGNFAEVPAGMAGAMSSDTILVYPSAVTGLPNPVSLALTRLDPNGAPRGQSITVARWPFEGAWPRMTMRGGDAVVGWLSGAQIRLARATP